MVTWTVSDLFIQYICVNCVFLCIHAVCTYLGSCGGPDWPTNRISAAKPRALAYSRRPDTALLFRWLMRSPTPASCAARNSSAVRGGNEGHVVPEPLPSLSLEEPRGNWGWKREKGVGAEKNRDVNGIEQTEQSSVTEVTKSFLSAWVMYCFSKVIPLTLGICKPPLFPPKWTTQVILCLSLLTLLSCSLPSAINSLTASSAASWRAAFLLGAEASENKLSPTFTRYMNLNTGQSRWKGWKETFFFGFAIEIIDDLSHLDKCGDPTVSQYQ